MLNRLFVIFLNLLILVSVNDAQNINPKQSSEYPLTELRNQLEDLFNDPNFSNALWAVEIKSLKNGEIIYKRNSNKLVVPASNLKLFTTAAAMLLLGSDYVYNTTIFTDGYIEKGILNGNLIIKGSGDPTISNRFSEGDTEYIFRVWSDSLKRRGINKINGNIIGDDRIFDGNKYGRGWISDNLDYWFSAPSGALSFNENSIEFDLKPGKSGLPAEIAVHPSTNYFNYSNKVITISNDGEEKIQINRDDCWNLITISGNVKESTSEFKAFASVNDPTNYFLTILKETFVKSGVDVTGEIIEHGESVKDLNYENLLPLFTYTSPPLFEIVKVTNKSSNNFYGEQLLRTLGNEIYGSGTPENGIRALKDLFNVMGINSENILIVDGSGLSLLNLVSPKQINNLLSYMYKSDEFKGFYNSLPIAGIDGTLAQRMLKSTAVNNVRAKTGYNTGVKALSGYLKTADDEPLSFSIIANNFLVSSNLADYIQDQVCIRLSNFSRK